MHLFIRPLAGLQCVRVLWQCREMFSGTFCYYIYIYISLNSSGAPVTVTRTGHWTGNARAH